MSESDTSRARDPPADEMDVRDRKRLRGDAAAVGTAALDSGSSSSAYVTPLNELVNDLTSVVARDTQRKEHSCQGIPSC